MDLNLAWPLPHGDEVRDRLLSAYADPTRGYHDLRHLSEVCARLDELAAAGTEFDRVAVGLAAWFHDAVYDALPGAEERSAAWAEHELGALGLDPAIVEEVARLVRLTETHRPADVRRQRLRPLRCRPGDPGRGPRAVRDLPRGRPRGVRPPVRRRLPGRARRDPGRPPRRPLALPHGPRARPLGSSSPAQPRHRALTCHLWPLKPGRPATCGRCTAAISGRSAGFERP